MVRDELGHHVLAARFMRVGHLNTGQAQHILEAFEILTFRHDHAGNAELDDGASAHHAGAERGIARDVLVGALPPGVLDRVHLAMQDRIALLHATIMATADDLAVAHQHRADRDTAF